MRSPVGFWPRARLGAWLLTAAYSIAAAFWCIGVGNGHERREIQRNHKYSVAMDQLEAFRIRIVDGDAFPPDEAAARFKAVNQDFAALAGALQEASAYDFDGVDALKWSTYWAGAGMTAYFGIALLASRRLERKGRLRLHSA